MKVRTNQALVASRQQWARWASLSGLLILVVGFIISYRWQTPVMIAVTWTLLVLGMIVSSVGVYLADKWVRVPRADEALESALKGFDDRYCLYNYTLPADHVLVSPYGVTVFTVRRHEDTVRYIAGKWKHEQSWLKRLRSLSRERIGDPVAQVERDVDRLERLVEQELSDAEIPVNGVIVFTHPDVALHIDGVPADVVHVKKLKGYIRRAGSRGERLRDELVSDLQEALDRR